MDRLLITICGRAGSKGFKNKNLKVFCGQPLVYYSLSAAELFARRHPELTDRKSTRLNSSHDESSRMPSSA